MGFQLLELGYVIGKFDGDGVLAEEDGSRFAEEESADTQDLRVD